MYAMAAAPVVHRGVKGATEPPSKIRASINGAVRTVLYDMAAGALVVEASGGTLAWWSTRGKSCGGRAFHRA